MVRALLFIPLFVEVYSLSVKPFVERTAVIEHPVYNYAHSACVNFLYEVGKIFVALFEVDFRSYALYIFGRVAVVVFPVLHTVVHIFLDNREVRVDMVVILSIVFMVGGRNEQRIEINSLYAQILQIVEFFSDPLQIAAVETADVEFVGIFIPLGYALRVPARVVIFVVLHVVRGVAVAETVGENLIENGALSPVGNLEARHERKVVFGLNVLDAAEAVDGDRAFRYR